ncbi:MAG TPA: dihydrolipoamide acetyltransferase family protein [Anaerolineales bacterium]|nr:dihydrolipoamide acetyltransferase family protein [Anaerolineales bacterium]
MASRVILPKLTYEMQAASIIEWLCVEGQEVSVGQPLLVIETDKAATEIVSDDAGTLLKIVVPPKVEIRVGTTLAWLGEPGEVVQEAGPQSQSLLNPLPISASGSSILDQQGTSPTSPAPESGVRADIVATPVAKRMAREFNLDLRDIAKKMGIGRVREADVQAYVQARESAVELSRHVSGALDQKAKTRDLIEKRDPRKPVEFDLVQPTAVQKVMEVRMVLTTGIPQMAAVCDIDLTHLGQLRDELQKGWEREYGFRLSYTHLFAALAAKAIKITPILNASWTEEGIRLYRKVGLAIAMATERGLVVPVVRNADERSLPDLAREIIRLQTSAKNNRLALDDLEGGTFTLTNVGVFGIEVSVPLLNPPQSAIMSIGARRMKLVLEDGIVKSIPVASITVVSDHRIVDGAAQGSFIRALSEYAENPQRALSV